MGKTKDVREAVEAELGFDPLIDATNITVRNVNGEVALNGTVPSYPQYLAAAAAARRVSGVTSLYNHLQVVLPEGSYRDDTMLTTAANEALEQNITVPDGVEATASDGNLTLTGTVAYDAERTAAESAVAGLAGVRNVRDDIDISYDADPVDVDLHVQDALERSALVPDDSDVKAHTEAGGVITLTGHVRTWAEHDAVVDARWPLSWGSSALGPAVPSRESARCLLRPLRLPRWPAASRTSSPRSNRAWCSLTPRFSTRAKSPPGPAWCSTPTGWC